MATKKTAAAPKKSRLDRMLDGIERAGNKLPDPITLFLYLAVIVVLVSWLCSALHVSVVNPANGETVTPVNLFSVYGIQYLWSNVITNFSGFAPLGMVLVAVIGSTAAEKSGSRSGEGNWKNPLRKSREADIMMVRSIHERRSDDHPDTGRREHGRTDFAGALSPHVRASRRGPRPHHGFALG